jgi:phosphoribosylformimino-5-aminoimidazole carboxamide ribotide isomerase
MLLVIPSIELVNGKCIYCICGETGTENYYTEISEHPYELCKLLRRENAKAIHIYDIDSFNNPENGNLSLLSYLVQSTDIPLLVHSNFQSIDECRVLFDYGVFRLVLDSLALTDTTGTKALIDEFTAARVIFNIPVVGSQVVFSHAGKSVDLGWYIEYLNGLGANRILYYELDNTETKPVKYISNLEIISNYKIKISVANDIENVRQLWKLNDYTGLGVDSIVIGKAFYENKFPCQKIWRLIEAKLEV